MEKYSGNERLTQPKNSRKSERSKSSVAEAQAQTESARALPAHEDFQDLKGAQPSNTAPSNCIEDSWRILHSGVDSLYLSFTGRLQERSEQQLSQLKALAQSESSEEKARAFLELDEERFEIRPHGASRFPFIMRNGGFNIRFSGLEAIRLPLAVVQVSSKLLLDSGLNKPVEYLRGVIREFGQYDEVKPSRVDLCCDFVSDIDISKIPTSNWISRSNILNTYSEGGEFTGYVFGPGNALSARIYDKTRQVKKYKLFHLHDHWKKRGWDGDTKVWRLEFQIRRSVLVEMGIYDYDDLVDSLQSLWGYATHHWLRLAVPGEDKTKSRWATHPLWEFLQLAKISPGGNRPLSRKTFKRVPIDSYFFKNGLAPITSYMASRGIPTFKEAGPQFLKEATDYHHKISLVTDEDIEQYCQKRAALKAKDYCTRFPFTERESSRAYPKEWDE